MTKDNAGNDPVEPDNLEDDLHPAEDDFLTETLGELDDLEVPAQFLPNVMFRVYERHHRNQLKWPRVISVSVVLGALAILFFVLDVIALQTSDGLESFDAAFAQRTEAMFARLEGMFATVGSVLTAGWQLLLGTFREATATVIGVLIALIAIVLVARKLLLSALR